MRRELSVEEESAFQDQRSARLHVFFFSRIFSTFEKEATSYMVSTPGLITMAVQKSY